VSYSKTEKSLNNCWIRFRRRGFALTGFCPFDPIDKRCPCDVVVRTAVGAGYRSISPRTMSRLPRIATTSAIIVPREIGRAHV
jgi:hypothetical protein